jgi:PST family polysaccharide transporter
MTSADRFTRYTETEGVRKHLKQKSVRAAVFMASGGGFDFAIRLASIAILGRLLVPEDFGVVAMVTALTAIVEGVKDLGLGTSTVQRRDITHRQITNLFWINSAGGVVFTLMFCLAAPWVGRFYGDDRLVGATVVLSLMFIWYGVSAQHEALMSRQLKQGELSAIRLIATFVSIVVAVMLAVGGWGYWALAWREVVRSAVVAIGVWVRCPWLPGLPTRAVETRSFLRFGRDLSATNLLTAVISSVDRLLVGRFFGADAVGMYRQAQQLLIAPIEQLNAPIMAVAQPSLSALQREPERYARYYEKVVFLVTMATLPLGLFCAVYAREIALLVLGPAWGGAAVFIMIFGLTTAIRPAVATSATVLITCGRSRRYLVINIVHSVLLAAFFAFGVKWGAEGVAVAHVAVTVVLLIPKLYYSFEGSPVSLGLFYRAVRTPLITGMVMVGGLILVRRLLPMPGTVLPLLIGSIAAAILCAAGQMIQPSGRRQIAALVKDVSFSLRRRVAVNA